MHYCRDYMHLIAELLSDRELFCHYSRLTVDQFDDMVNQSGSAITCGLSQQHMDTCCSVSCTKVLPRVTLNHILAWEGQLLWT